MRRRSVSSFVSPGPRVPIPPPSRLNSMPLAPKAGQAVAQQGQLDLEHALPAGGVLGEDVEDDGHPVNHVTLEEFLEVALLSGREAVVEHHHIHIEPIGVLSQRLRLARAYESSRMGRPALEHHRTHRRRPGRVGQQPEFVHRTTCAGGGVPIDLDSDQPAPSAARLRGR